MEDSKKGEDEASADEVVRDAKSDEMCKEINEEELGNRRKDVVWFGTEIHVPFEGEKRERPAEKRARRRRSTLQQLVRDGVQRAPLVETIDEENTIVLAPSERIQHLLNQPDKHDAMEKVFPHQLFTEMELLCGSGPSQEWRETARWVKYEEVVEEGGNRWSKPHVATLTLQSLFELRSCFLKGIVILDMFADDLEEVIEKAIARLTKENLLKRSNVSTVRDALLSKHKHQYETNRHHKDGMSTGHSFLQTVRSFADIGRSFSHAKTLNSANEANAGLHVTTPSGQLTVPESQKLQVSPPVKVSSQKGIDGNAPAGEYAAKGNYHLYKKLPRDAEASNVLIGQLQSLESRLSVFIRLQKACYFENLTEVPVPTRFLFILLGPKGCEAKYREVGRAVSTLMSDVIFCEVAYQARDRQDLLDGLDEFLEQVTVLPPGEWDPSIRIEPPPSVPSQEARKKPPPKADEADASLKEVFEKHLDDDDALKRTHKFFGGLIKDVKRKIKWYRSDFTDACNLQCVAAFMYMYFAMLAPIVTFGGLLEEATDRHLAAIENLFSGAICGFIYSMFAGQPLTMIGSTGPVLIFEKVVFDICKEAGLGFLSVRFWINFWSFVILLIIVATDASAMVSYITRFTEESFAALISFIFIFESIAKLLAILDHARIIIWNPISPGNGTCTCANTNSTDVEDLNAMAYRKKWSTDGWLNKDQSTNSTLVDWDNIPLDYCGPANGHLEGTGCYKMYDVFLASILLVFGTFTLATMLKCIRNSSYFPSRVRAVLSDFAVILSIVVMISVDMALGLQTPKLYVPEKFEPTHKGRGWLVNPLPDSSTWWIIPLGLPPALLLCILLFMDHQITVVIVNRKENKLKKGCGYHLDLLLIAFVCLITGFLGLPIFVAATVMSISHVNALRQLSECQAPGEKPKFIGVREQRVTGILVFLFIGLSVLMTSILKHIPMPVLYGVFLYMGISSLAGVQMVDRLLLLFMPMKYQPDYIYLRHVPIGRVHLFTFCQISCFAVLCVIKEVKATSVGFPLLLVFLVAVRKLLEFVFTDHELRYLDDKMPDIFLRHKEDVKIKKEKEMKEHVKNALVALQSDDNLQISLSSGHVMNIPLKTLNRSVSEDKAVNLSEEVTRSGLWKHIASSSDMTKVRDNGKKKMSEDRGNTLSPASLTEEDDIEAITISFDRSMKSDSESKPLLNAGGRDGTGTSQP
uniref:Anion exchange protein n=1 Tax=Trichuris muris TaxID=70415 RepID=A0A5S6QCK9_TRIMR